MYIKFYNAAAIFISAIGVLTACEDGWVHFQNRCYFYSKHNKSNKIKDPYNQTSTSKHYSRNATSTFSHSASYQEAMIDCDLKNSELLTFSSIEETEFIYKLIADNNSSVWIGNISRSRDYRNIMQLNFATNKTGFSTTLSPEEACNFISSTRKKTIFTDSCEKEYFYICRKSKNQGKYYSCEECKSRRKRSPLNTQQNLQISTAPPRHTGLLHFLRNRPFSNRFQRVPHPWENISPFQSRFSSPFGRPHQLDERTHYMLQSNMRTIPPLFKPIIQNVPHRLGLKGRDNGSSKESTRSSSFIPLLSDEPKIASKGKDFVLANTSAALSDSALYTDETNITASMNETQLTLPPTADSITVDYEKESLTVTPLGSKCHEDEVFNNGSCYTKIDPGSIIDFDNAMLGCQERNSTLIIINTDEEEAFLAKLMENVNSSLWIGLRSEHGSQDARLLWIDGITLTPPNKYIIEGDSENQCMVVANNGNESLAWSLKNCNENFTYVCERKENPVLLQKDGCLEGWEHVGNSCYKVFSKPASWNASEKHCTTFGAHLASAGSVEEEDILRRLAQSAFVSDFFLSVWIGLEIISETDYRWTDNTPKGYLNWAQGQPDFHQAKEHCGSATRTGFTIHDSPCSGFLPFICEAKQGSMVITKHLPQIKPNKTCDDDSSWLLYDKHCYKIISSEEDSGSSWFESRRLCRDIGGELASVHSVEENYWLQSQVHSVQDNVLWIGGMAYIDSGYEWADGTPYDYNNWAKGEPNNHYDQEDCIAFYTRNFGYWNDQNCGHKQGRICKRALGTMHPPHVTTPAPEGNCPAGWIHTGIKCLKFVQGNVTFDGARKDCKGMGLKAELASISSAKEQAYVTAAIGELKMNMWLGLRYEQGFHWMDQSALTYTNWAQGEPNSRGWLDEDRNENCVNTHIFNLAGHWNDINCESPNGYVCQTRPDSSHPSSNPFPTCDPPFENYVRYDNKCYRAETATKTWKDAELTCKNEGGHLVSAANKAESSWLWVLAQQYDLEDPWIGCNDLGKDAKVFQWSDSWPTLYTQWGKGEPNISSTNHSCATVSSENGQWYLENCNTERSFICKYNSETPPTPDTPSGGVCANDQWLDLGGSFCYLLVTDSRPWTDANKWCANQGSELASIHSKSELDLLIQAAHNIKDPMWIGLIQMKEGFGWSDGSGYDFINWQSGEPNSGREECIEMYPGSGQWNDNFCSNARPFICKAVKISNSTNTLGVPEERTSEESNTGTIVGVVLALMLLVLGGLLCFVHRYRRRPRPLATSGAFGFDNAVYSADENEQEEPNNSFNLRANVTPGNDESDADDERDDTDSQ